MPHLNWKDAPLVREVRPLAGSADKMELSLAMSQAQRDELLPRLREVLEAELPAAGLAAELRLDLPGEWILFWKLREGESRLLIAHPAAEEWVATAALGSEHASAFLSRLGALSSGDALRLGELGPVAGVSNVEIILTLS